MPFGAKQIFSLAMAASNRDLDAVESVKDGAKAFETNIKALIPQTPISEAALIEGAVVATIAAVGLAYYAISNRIDNVDDECEGFKDMIDANASTYFIKKDDSSRYDWDKYVNAFVSYLQGFQGNDINSLLLAYSGLHVKTITTSKKKGTMYSVFSMFSCPLGVYFEQPRDDGETIDEAKQALNIFIKADLVNLMNSLAQELDTPLISVQLFFQAERHLSFINSTRMVVILIGNIILNLLYAMDPRTNKPVDLVDLVSLCAIFIDMIQSMRNELDNNQFKDFKQKICLYKKFDDFLQILEVRILKLQEGYSHSLKHRINLNSVINSAYSVMENTSSTIRKILYLDSSYVEPAGILCKIIYLADLIDQKPNLLKKLKAKLPGDFKDKLNGLGLNPKLSTIIDVIAIYSSLNASERQTTLGKFSLRKEENIQFVSSLRAIDIEFISPIERSDNAKTDTIGFSTSLKKIASTRYFICYIALLLEVSNVTIISKDNPLIKDANQQVREINKKVFSDEAIYRLDYLFELDLHGNTKKYWIEFLKVQYVMLAVTRMLAQIATLIAKNERIESDSRLQDFLIKRLNLLKNINADLLKITSNLIRSASPDRKSNKDLLQVLAIIDLKSGFSCIQLTKLIEALDKNIDQSIAIIQASTFDDENVANSLNQILSIKEYDSASYFESEEEFESFYQTLATYVGGAPSSLESLSIVHQPKPMALNTDDNFDEDITPTFKLDVYIKVIACISLSLFVLGLLTLILMAYAAPNITFFVGLSSSITASIMLAGYVSSATGGLGLAVSCFSLSFFKNSKAQITSDTHKDNIDLTM